MLSNVIWCFFPFSYHIPEIRIVTVEPLRSGKECELILKFINPTQHQTTVSFLPLTHEKPVSEISFESEETFPLQTTEDQAVNVSEVIKLLLIIVITIKNVY